VCLTIQKVPTVSQELKSTNAITVREFVDTFQHCEVRSYKQVTKLNGIASKHKSRPE